MEDGIEQHLSIMTNMIIAEKINENNKNKALENENITNKALEKDNKKNNEQKKEKQD